MVLFVQARPVSNPIQHLEGSSGTSEDEMNAVTGPLESALAELLERFHAAEAVALGRAISLVENERPGFEDFLHEVLRVGPSAARIGFTGPPGAGKSSLLSVVATIWRTRNEQLGVVAVDPTSPYSGGALLGDRIRMSDLATDPGIFIRSMATRGSLGGLATTTKEVIDLMDAFGFDRVLVETVGVGQTQIEITAAADTVIVVLVPESGDAIQAMKAGLMEIADIFVVNKADRPGADRLVKDLRQGLHLRVGTVLESEPVYHGLDLARIRRKESGEEFKGPGWSPPVLSTVAQSGEGVEHLMDMIEAHRSWLEESGELEERRRARGKVRIQDVVDRELRRTAWHSDAILAVLDQGLDRIQKGKDTPYSVAWDIVNRLLR